MTSVFDAVVNGPGTYAQYLWQHFRDDDDIDFHLVAPRSSVSHPRLHTVDATGHKVMWAIQETAKALAAEQPERTIVHGNSAYMMFKFVGHAGPWIAQVNDYEAATAWDSPWRIARDRGLRRLASLAWRLRQERRVVRTATRVICNSHFVRDEIVRRYRPDEDRVSVIHKAVDVASFVRPTTLPRDPIAAGPMGTRFLFVGTNWRLKGLPTLLQALRTIAREFPNCHLTIAGPQGSERSVISAMARKLSVDARINFAGRVDRCDLPMLMWHSDLLILPTHAEAFGVVILEALAAGLPVIASDVGGIPEIVDSPDVGVLIPPDDVDSLARAIGETLANEDFRRNVLKTGRARAAEFSVEKMIAQVKQLYLSLPDRSS